MNLDYSWFSAPFRTEPNLQLLYPIPYKKASPNSAISLTLCNFCQNNEFPVDLFLVIVYFFN